MAQLDMHQPSKIYRGTVDEVFSHRSEIPPSAILELRVFDEMQVQHTGAVEDTPQASQIEGTTHTRRKRPSALGKYSFVAGSSEEFAKEKQLEIEREDRSR